MVIHVVKEKKLLEMCGLSPEDPTVSHCFADGTHHTCYMLGKKARQGSNATGNPIGTASEKSFKMSYEILKVVKKLDGALAWVLKYVANMPINTGMAHTLNL